METTRVTAESGAASIDGGVARVVGLKAKESISKLEKFKSTFLGWRIGPTPGRETTMERNNNWIRRRWTMRVVAPAEK
ncbi:hypothetical protein FH972_006086 [Carpinus fangiana]|uniref:Uncharacterized protein n=1 Tax=Carpinus fangiana TaxID=176857 RepID=A0A5N6QUR2_9ROSI|nr:hypothetical protein FH972_006086 [Carpinus fangiana]